MKSIFLLITIVFFLTIGCDETPIEPPVVTLVGDEFVIVEHGGHWSDPGATATDGNNQDISDLVTIGGDTVNTRQCGHYTIEYTVSDSHGNTAEPVFRTVEVVYYQDDFSDPDFAALFDPPIDHDRSWRVWDFRGNKGSHIFAADEFGRPVMEWFGSGRADMSIPASDFEMSYQVLFLTPATELFTRLRWHWVDGQSFFYGLELSAEEIRLTKRAPSTTLLARADVTLTVDQWHAIEIVFDGATLEVLVDGDLVLSYRDDDPLLTGNRASFRGGEGAQALYDNFLIRCLN